MSKEGAERPSIDSITSVETSTEEGEDLVGSPDSSNTSNSTDSYVSQAFINIIESSYRRVPVIISNTVTSYSHVYFLNDFTLRNKQIYLQVDEGVDAYIDIPISYSREYGFIVYYSRYDTNITVNIEPETVYKLTAFRILCHKPVLTTPLVERRKKMKGVKSRLSMCSV